MFAVPFRQNATERSDTARTAVFPIFLNVRNMPIAEKCTTTGFSLSNSQDAAFVSLLLILRMK
jgi:hypothetical protein